MQAYWTSISWSEKSLLLPCKPGILGLKILPGRLYNAGLLMLDLIQLGVYNSEPFPPVKLEVPPEGQT